MGIQFYLNKEQFGWLTALWLLIIGKTMNFSYRSDIAHNNVAMSIKYYGLSLRDRDFCQNWAIHAMRRNGKLLKAFKKMTAYRLVKKILEKKTVLGKTATILVIPHWEEAMGRCAGGNLMAGLTFSIWAVHSDRDIAAYPEIQPRDAPLSEGILKIFQELDKMPGVIELIGNAGLSWTLDREFEDFGNPDTKAFLKAFDEKKGAIVYMGSVTL